MDTNLSEVLVRIIQKVDHDIANGLTKNIRQAIWTAFEIVKADPLIFYHDKNAKLLGKTLMLVLLYNLSEDEEDLITAAHLSYFYLRQAKKQSETDKEILEINKNAVALLSEFSDYFRHTVAMCYRGQDQNPSPDAFQRSLSIADMRSPLLEFLLLEEINLLFTDYNNDEFLIDRENIVFSQNDTEDMDLEEARKLDQVILGYIAKKIELKDLIF